MMEKVKEFIGEMMEKEYEYEEGEEWIQTYSGRRFTPLKPNVDAIVIQDIAHALSMQCRFSGHIREFYSVAQHSVLVSYFCDREDAIWGLLHDATEAYLVDIPRPLKVSGKFEKYVEYERVMQGAISKKFGIGKEEPESVKEADRRMCITEAAQFLKLREDWGRVDERYPIRIEALGHKEAKELFIKRYLELTGNMEAYKYYKYYDGGYERE